MNISISSSVKGNIKDTVKLAQELDTNIEICKFVNSDTLDGDYSSLLQEYSEALRDFQGKISLHGPFFDLNPASKDSRVVEVTIHRYNQALSIAKTLNAGTIVFHTGYNGLVKSPVYHNKFIDNQIVFWTEFIKKFEDAGITVALENTYENTPEVIITAINAVNSKYLKACIDCGHVNINSSMNIYEWIHAFGNNLHHMHLHNNSGRFDEHNSLLSGTLDFREIINRLKEMNLNPNLILEIFQEKLALASIEFVKNELDLASKVNA